MKRLARERTKGPRLRLGLLLTFGLCLTASAGSAQQTIERTPATRGLIGDTATLLAARDAAARAGIDCNVTEAALRGLDNVRNRHYEVSCLDAPGYLIVAGTSVTADNCLLLASQNERLERAGSSVRRAPICLLRANRNPTRHLASIAGRAGVDCRVDEARVLGLSFDQGPIYEIGCRGAIGSWIQQTTGGWIVTDCLEVRARGDICQFTSETEELVDFRRLLAGSTARDCRPSGLRSMGRNAAGLSFYEVNCADSVPVIVSLDNDRRVSTVLTCAEAAHIGDGCRAAPPPPER